MRPVVLCDVDSVIADFQQIYLSLAKQVTGRDLPGLDKLTHLQMETSLGLSNREALRVESMLQEPGFAQRIPAYPEAIVGVKAVVSIADLLFVTSPLSLSHTWCFDRTAWLIRHFGMALGERVIQTHSKEYVAGHLFIDDKPSNIKKWAIYQAGQSSLGEPRIGLLWDWPYNSEKNDPSTVGLRRSHDWDEVLTLVREMGGGDGE